VSRVSIPWLTLATAALLAGGAAYLLAASATIPAQARLYPRIFLLAILAGSILLVLGALFEAWQSRRHGAEKADPPEESDRAGWPLFVAMLLYALALNPLGFVVSSILFMVLVLLWLRVPAMRAVLLSFVGVLGIFIVFRTLMYVSLPTSVVDVFLLELLYGAWR
jgi:hypothetical protein